MKEIGILFKAEMVKAVLAGKKDVTRRLVKFPECPCGCNQVAEFDGTAEGGALVFASRGDQSTGTEKIRCRYVAGRTLWVRETWAPLDGDFRGIPRSVKQGDFPADVKASYRADHHDTEHGDGPDKLEWRPSLLMPRWASRITLECLSVRAEPLHAITDDDARREGVRPFFETFPSFARDQTLTTGESASDAPYRAGFAVLWDEINGDRVTWKSNPYVWRIEFRRVS